MVDKQKIMQILKYNFSTGGRVTITAKGEVNVAGYVVSSRRFPTFPVKFNKISLNFRCSNGSLQSLVGGPKHVGGYFICDGNQLTSLEGSPLEVGSHFNCSSNKLTSLEGMSSTIGGRIIIHDNPDLNSLKGLPISFDYLQLTYVPHLPLLRCLCAKKVSFVNRNNNSAIQQIESVLNEFAGQGKAGVLKCSHALLSLEKELQKEDPTISLRDNIKW